MKRLFTFFAIIMLTFAFSFSAFATNDAAENGYAVTVGESVEVSDSVSEGEDGVDNGDGREDENFFALVYERICDNAGEIISAFTLIFTALLTLAYKKGLIPAIKGGLSAIGGAISSVKESAERGASALDAKGEKMLDAANLTAKSVSVLEEKLCALEERLDSINRLERFSTATQTVLKCQVETLAQIFMSSALPEYKKEELSRKISDMMGAIEHEPTEN